MVTKSGKIAKLLILSLPLITFISCGDKSAGTYERCVKLTTPQLRENGYTREYPAIVKESNETGLGFKTAGQISHIYVKEGDYVKQGQLLASLDAADYQLGVNALQVQYDQLKREFERVQKMFENKGVPQNEYEKAKAGLEQLATQLQANKNKLSYTRLYAPVNGYIQSVNFSKAEMVDAGTQVFSIIDDGGMKVEFDVPVSESGSADSSAIYTLDYNGLQTDIPLRYISKSPKADGNQLFTVKLGVVNRKSASLRPGMNATVRIAGVSGIEEPKAGYNLPLRAVVNRDGKVCVWVLKPDSTVSLREVIFSGVDKNGMAIIESGVNAEDRIITAGVNSLHEGEKVVVREDESATNVGGLI